MRIDNTIKLIIVFVLSSLSVNAQTIDYKTQAFQGVNFHELVSRVRSEFNVLAEKGSLTRAQNKAQKQFERWVYSMLDHVGADGKLPTGLVKDATRSVVASSMQVRRSIEATSNTASWTQIGPVDNPNINGYAAYPGKGRINVVVEDPTNTNIMYAGAAAGGVWKTTDNGNTWNPLTDNFAGMGVSDILVDPNNTNIIYVATGDGNGTHVSSIGVYRSTNGGSSWNPTGLVFNLTENEYIRDLAFAPGNSNKIFALTNEEIKVSSDSGVNWINSNIDHGAFSPFTESFQTIVFDPNDPDKVVVSDVWDGIFYSTDGGDNFILHPAYPGGNSQAILKLTASASDNDHFYGLGQDGAFRKYRFAFDNTANDLVSTTNIAGYNSQGGYNMCLAVSPTSSNNIMVGGVRGYISTNNGSSFSVVLNPYNDPPGVGFYVHPDHHHLSFLSDGTTILNGHDGGIHKGTFAGASNTWMDLSPGLIITQSYNIAVTQEASGDNFIMANQDNDGFSKVSKNGTRQWVSAVAGDGTGAGIDFNTPNTRYLGGTFGSLIRTDDGFASSYDSGIQILNQDQMNASFVSPMVIHPVTPTTIYTAHGDLKRSINRGGSFTALGTGLTKIDFVEVVTANTSMRIFVRNEDGIAKLSTNDGATWSNVTAPVGQTINSFAAIPNSTTVYATVSGYSNGNKVYKSTNNGANWTNMSTGLPNIIIKEIVVKVDATNTETLFLATELGVYFWTSETETWNKLGSGLPNVRVDDLKINYTDQELYAGTFGRGMWKIDVSPITLSSDSNEFEKVNRPVIYPNPVIEGSFGIDIPNAKDIEYAIYSVLGGIMKEGTIESGEKINVSDLSSGVYLLKVTAQGNVSRQKLIVK